MSTILVVDDEERLRSLLVRSLSDAGHSYLTAADGVGALSVLESHDVDLVLLDLVMPRMDGMNVLSHMRSDPDAPPVIVLTGVEDSESRIWALGEGAIDVVRKPFSMAELLARVNRHLPKTPTRDDERFLSCAGLTLDTHRRVVRAESGAVQLSEKEFTVLAYLVRHRGDVCRREELLREVWGLEFDPLSNVLDVCLGRLRTKLGDDSPIETVRGVGYCIPE